MRTAYIVVCLDAKERFKYTFTCKPELTDLDRYATLSAVKLIEKIKLRYKHCNIAFPVEDDIPAHLLKKNFRSLTMHEQQVVGMQSSSYRKF